MTGPLLTVPDAADVALVDEARRLAEQLSVDEGGGDARVNGSDADADADDADADADDADAAGDRPSVVVVAFDGVLDPATAGEAAPDEVVRVVRESGDAFATGAAGVRARAAALASLATDAEGFERPTAVLLPDTPDGDDLAAATARRVRGGCVTDCLLRVRDGTLRAGRAVYGGRAYAELSFEGGPPVVTLNTDALGTPAEPPPGSPRERTVAVTVQDGTGVRRLGVVDVPERDLSRARRIVAGGYGLGGPESFDVVEDLADALGAAVGASRPPADEGWVPYDRQIGVTGKEIDVELYVPVAISGDSYHMRSVNADVVLPVNTDREARVFNFADLGVVGDAHEYAPAIAAAVRAAAADEDGGGGGGEDEDVGGGGEEGDGGDASVHAGGSNGDDANARADDPNADGSNAGGSNGDEAGTDAEDAGGEGEVAR